MIEVAKPPEPLQLPKREEVVQETSPKVEQRPEKTKEQGVQAPFPAGIVSLLLYIVLLNLFLLIILFYISCNNTASFTGCISHV